MKSIFITALLATSALMAQTDNVHVLNSPSQAVVNANPNAPITIVCEHNAPECACEKNGDGANGGMNGDMTLAPGKEIRVNVVGQGVAPVNTSSPAQAYALSKRSAIADAYRLIAEKVKGVRVEGHDVINNMMVKRSTVRTYVDAMIRQANIIETTFKEGLCEVEMEVVLNYSQLVR